MYSSFCCVSLMSYWFLVRGFESIYDLVTMIQVRAESKNLSLVLRFDSHLPKRLYGDEVHIKQIVTNILTNAVKYTEKGSVTFSLGFERIEEAPD